MKRLKVTKDLLMGLAARVDRLRDQLLAFTTSFGSLSINTSRHHLGQIFNRFSEEISRGEEGSAFSPITSRNVSIETRARARA